jgi:hypothetical protein
MVSAFFLLILLLLRSLWLINHVQNQVLTGLLSPLTNAHGALQFEALSNGTRPPRSDMTGATSI